MTRSDPTKDERRRLTVVLGVAALGLSGCNATRPSAEDRKPDERAKAADADPGVEPDSAGSGAGSGEAPPVEPPPDGAEVLARRSGIALTRGMSAEALTQAWPGITLRPEPDFGGHALLNSAGGLLAWYDGDAALCFMGPGLTGPEGVEVGAKLSSIEGAEAMACEVAVGDELEHLGDQCPRELEGETMLVCELESPFRRLFFEVDEVHGARAGDELRGEALAAFGDPPLLAMSLLADVEPEADEPAPAPAPAPAGRALLAQIPDEADHALRVGDPNSEAVIEAALPGFEFRARRHYGSFVYRGKTKVALVMTEIGAPFEELTLLGPGLADPRGIEVGASFDAIAGFSGLECNIDGGEDYTGIWVDCHVGAPVQSHYIFARDFDEELAELSVERARELVGDTRLTAIGLYKSED